MTDAAHRAQAWASLVLHFEDEGMATAVEQALAPENGPHCRTRLDGATLRVEVPEARLGSVALTIDDLLACASAAERAQDAVKD